jgi:hypothetical protein
MGVKQFSPVPGAKSGKPVLPNSFTVTPSTDGTKGTGSAPETAKAGSVGGNAAQRFDPKKNYAGKQTFVSTDIPSRVKGAQSKLPDKVQTDFKVRP